MHTTSTDTKPLTLEDLAESIPPALGPPFVPDSIFPVEFKGPVSTAPKFDLYLVRVPVGAGLGMVTS